FRSRPGKPHEPEQVHGNTKLEILWTLIPAVVLAVIAVPTVRTVFRTQGVARADALQVEVVGHQWWWEFRYPQYNVVTANELYLPVSSKQAPRPTFMKLTSADVMHSFWVPQLDGKTDLLPNRVNEMWIDPQQAGLFVGQCAQFCG